jgi:cytochrome P450
MTATDVEGIAAAPYWDPFDEVIDTDPHPTWRRLRDEAPLYRNDRYDFWALSRHADVEAASRDTATFSSAHGTVLEFMTEDFQAGGTMIFMDPPDHTRLRHLVSRAFTPRRIGRLEDRVRELCVAFLDAQSGALGFDYLQDFGARLPAMVIASLLGVPIEEQEDVRHTIDQLFVIDEGKGMGNDVSMQAGAKLYTYLSALLEERRAAPQDDMLSDLVQAELTDDDGTVRRLTHNEATGFAILLIGAGTETVARLLGWAAVLLARHASGPCSSRTRPASPTPSRSCCGTRRRRRCRGAGPSGTSTCTARSSRPARRCCCSPVPQVATSASTTTPTASTSCGPSTATCRSATASTSASGPPWPAWRAASPSRRR